MLCKSSEYAAAVNHAPTVKLCNPRDELDLDSKQLLQATLLCGCEQLIFVLSVTQA